VKKIVLADAPNGTVVRVGGNWGVVCSSTKGSSHRTVDFWDGGRRHVQPWTLVEIPTKRKRKEVAV